VIIGVNIMHKYTLLEDSVLEFSAHNLGNMFLKIVVMLFTIVIKRYIYKHVDKFVIIVVL
jgi:hypothetical protein